MPPFPQSILASLMSCCIILATFQNVGCQSKPEGKPVVDSDNDGLADELEHKIGTSPEDPDTDGDGFLDGKEYSLQTESDPYTYNPLIADTTKILVTVTGQPEISVDYVTSDGKTVGESIAKGTAVSRGTNTSITEGESEAVEESVQVQAQVGTQSHFSETISYSVRGESSFSETTTTSEELQETMQNVKEKSNSSEISKTSGRMHVSVNVQNTGHIAATLQGFTLSAFLVYADRPGVEVQLGGMNYDNRWGEFPAVTLKPGEQKSGLPFTKTEMNLETIEKVIDCLAGGGRVVIRVATYQLIDPNDEAHRPLDRFFTEIDSKTTTVTIDYGPQLQASKDRELKDEKDPAEVFYVSTFAQNGEPMTAAGILDRLSIPFKTGTAKWSDGSFGRTKNGLVKVRNCATNAEVGGYWVVAYTPPSSGAKREATLFNPLKNSVDLESLVLEPRSRLQLVYISDQDHDRLGDRNELAIGSNPLVADTDGDGLDDGEEVYGWKITQNGKRVLVTSNPLYPDTDDDGISDKDEKLAGTNPNRSEHAIIVDWRVVYSRQLGTQERDSARYLAIDKDDIIYLAGDTWGNSIDNNSGGPYAIAKYQPDGVRLWIEQHRNVTAYMGTTYTGGMAIDYDGNMYTVDSEYTKKESHGKTIVTRKNYLKVNKFSPTGQKLWSKELDSKSSDLAHGLVADNAGNVYVVGYTQGTLGDRGKGDWKRPSQEAFLAKYDTNGNVLWIKQWQTTRFENPVIDVEGNILMLASTNTSLDGEPYVVNDVSRNQAIVKYSPDGERLWVKQLGFEKRSSITTLATDDQGDIYIAGGTSGHFDGPNKGSYDAYVMKLTSDGEQQWVRQLGTAGMDQVESLTIRNSTVYATGNTRGDLGSNSTNVSKVQDMFVATFSLHGKPLHVKQLKTANSETLASSAVDSQGNIYLFATTNGSFNEQQYKNRGNNDMLLLKLMPVIKGNRRQI